MDGSLWLWADDDSAGRKARRRLNWAKAGRSARGVWPTARFINRHAQDLPSDYLPVVSVKIPSWVQEKMNAYSRLVDWQEEITRMLVSRVEELEGAKAVDQAVGALGSVGPTPSGTARKLVKKDRDSH